MKVFRKLNFAVISTLAIFLIYCQEPEVEREDIKTEIDRISYGLGNDFGANIRGQSDSVDIEIVLNGLNTRLNRGILETEFEDKMTEELYGIGASFGQMIINENVAVEKRILSKGVRDGYNNGEKLLSPLELTEAKELFQQKFIVLSDEAKNNGKEGAKFLMENAKNEDVFVLPSGMQYKILKEGSGQIPVVTDAVKLHYTGRYVDGTEFESTYTDNNPHTIVIEQIATVFKGWADALLMMNVGSKWRIYIPPQLGYGIEGNGMAIGPNQTLIYDLELLEIVKFE